MSPLSLTVLAQALVSGLLIGGVYALVSIGLTLIFGVVKVVNFAHGEFLMLGMYATFFLWSYAGLDPLAALPITLPLLFLVGVLTQQFLIRHVLHASELAQIFLTVGLQLILQNLALLLFTANYRSVQVPYADWTVNLGGVVLQFPRLLAFAVALVLSTGLYLFLHHTDLGKAMRAAAEDREVAMLMGINPDRIYLLALGIGAALTGAAGTVIMPFYYAFPTVGNVFGLLAFVVVILGGLGDVKGAFLGGLIVGAAESLGIQYAGADAGLLVAFVILVLVLIFRPQGLLARGRG